MIQIIFALVILGVILYLIETFIPMDPAIKVIIRVVVIIFMILYLMYFLGLTSFPTRIR